MRAYSYKGFLRLTSPSMHGCGYDSARVKAGVERVEESQGPSAPPNCDNSFFGAPLMLYPPFLLQSSHGLYFPNLLVPLPLLIDLVLLGKTQNSKILG